MLFEHMLTLCRLANTAEKGLKPKDALRPYDWRFFGDRTIGYSRNYAAMGADQRIDRLVRIWRSHQVRTGDYTLIGNEQYRVEFVQHLTDEDNLEVSDLTLRRLETNYDVIAEQTQESV